MTWDKHLADLFADLEQQADGLALAARDADVRDASREGYAEVDLQGRLQASQGRRVRVDLPGHRLVGMLIRVGDGWCLLEVDGSEWVIVLSGVAAFEGLSERTVPKEARGVLARLRLTSVLRRLAEGREEVRVTSLDQAVRRGVVRRVGADFLELEVAGGGLEVLPLSALLSLRRR